MTNKDSLTVMQEKAIQLLMTGGSDQAVADELDIARQTVNNFCQQHLQSRLFLDRIYVLNLCLVP